MIIMILIYSLIAVGVIILLAIMSGKAVREDMKDIQDGVSEYKTWH
jgi:hypothetical protein